MAVKVGINGFGWIGRNILRASLGDPTIEFVAVNDITDPKTLSHFLEYDSVLGNLDANIWHGDARIRVNGRSRPPVAGARDGGWKGAPSSDRPPRLSYFYVAIAGRLGFHTPGG